MEIGDNILFKNGVKAWQGNKEEIFITDNEAVVDFVYSSNLEKWREAYLKGNYLTTTKVKSSVKIIR
jgi:phospholipid/cholesterol/gamma-HCH transport system ATP-binding protein